VSCYCSVFMQKSSLILQTFRYLLCHRFVRWQRQPSGFATGQGFSFSAAVTVAYFAQTAEFCHSMVAPSTSFATLDISRIRIATVSWTVYEPRRSRSNGVQYYHCYSAPPPIGERSIVINLSVCLCVCVCVRACVRACVCVCVCVCVCLSAITSSELHVRSSPIFCACYLWPWLGLPLPAQ